MVLVLREPADANCVPLGSPDPTFAVWIPELLHPTCTKPTDNHTNKEAQRRADLLTLIIF